MTLECARERATFLPVSRSRHGEASSDISTSLAFDDVANEVFRRYGRHWKPRTLEVNLGYYRNQILVWFKGRAIGDITRHDVQRWFVSLHATPVAADRSAPVLSVILRQAEVYGHRPEGSHPCTGIKRYRRRHRERFLNGNEIGRPSRVLDDKCEKRPLMAAIVRILHLTGCRKSEILTLKWSDYREGRLYLQDSKTRRRTDWLSLPAHRILDALP